MKDKEYHVANFASSVSKKLLFFFPRKMDEFNFKPAQYRINKIFDQVLSLGVFKMDVIKWELNLVSCNFRLKSNL